MVADYVCFTDSESLTAATPWRIIKRVQVHPDANRDAKRFKILAHEHVDADAVVWIDRHCRLLCDPFELFSAHPAADLILLRHSRGCIYHEARACVARKKDDPITINKQIESYRAMGHPPRFGLWYGGCLFRRMNSRTQHLAETWWSLIADGSKRDQLSLPVAIRSTGVNVVTISRDKVLSSQAK